MITFAAYAAGRSWVRVVSHTQPWGGVAMLLKLLISWTYGTLQLQPRYWCFQNGWICHLLCVPGGRVGSSQVDSTCSQQCCAGVACHSQRQWLRLPYDLVTPAPGNPPAQGLILALGHSCIWPPTMMGAPLDLICRWLCICQSLWVDQSCAHSFC